MSDKLTIYHGSSKIIERPDFGTGNPHNDYSLGFYCTESMELAKEWASSTETDGFANQYQINLTRRLPYFKLAVCSARKSQVSD